MLALATALILISPPAARLGSAERDRRWPNDFLFEPGLDYGVRF